MTSLYILDTGALFTLGNFYPGRFPTIWARIDELVIKNRFLSVREVKREIENNCPFPHIEDWVKNNSHIFRKPDSRELHVVDKIFQIPQFLGLVRRNHILRALPVADPFVVAAAKVHNGIVITREVYKDKGARIPNVCKEFDVKCINFEEFLEREKLKY